MLFKDLETRRLYLRNISKADLDFIYTQFSNDLVNLHLYDVEPVLDIQGADEIIEYYTQPEPRGHHRWILVRKADDVKIGTCGFHGWDRENKCCDIGYDLYPDYWGNGFMFEALLAIIDFAMKDMDIKCINACIYTENEKSFMLAEKLGFQFSGKIKNEIFLGNKYPHKIFSLSL